MQTSGLILLFDLNDDYIINFLLNVLKTYILKKTLKALEKKTIFNFVDSTATT